MKSPREASLISSTPFSGLVHDISTLNKDKGLFVAINQDESESADTATVVAGTCYIYLYFWVDFPVLSVESPENLLV